MKKIINIRLLCFNKSKAVSYSRTCWGSIHLHFAQGESLPISGDNHIHKATLHAAFIAVVCVGFTRSDVGDGSTPDSGGSVGGDRGDSQVTSILFICTQV